MNLIYHAGYVKFNLNRKSKIGGGVCIYIKDNIKAKIRNDITSECNTSNIESIFIELLNPKEKNIILGLVYRPPNNMCKDFEEKIESALNRIDNESKTCYLLGDFNIDLLKHEKCEYSARFLNQMMSSMFLPTILKPTRITRTTATLIDNIFTTVENNIRFFLC